MSIYKFLYLFICFGSAFWFWIIRKELEERGWDRAHYWATNFSIGAGATGALVLTGQVFNDIIDLLVGILILAVSTSLARVIWARILAGLGIGGKKKDHIRGAKLADSRQIAKQLRGQRSRFAIGQIPVPVELETRGFLLAGSPGTGKSQALTGALDALRADGARAILADASGIYASRFFDPARDVLINPFDARSVSWSPLAEIETVADIPALAKSLIPDQEGEARVWANYAQVALGAILEYCFTRGLTNSEIFRLVAVAGNSELQQVFAGTPAQPFVSDGNEKMFASVRGSMVDALGAIRYLDPDAGANSFSVRKHITGESQGWIFLSYQQQHRDALRNMIACAMDAAARAVLSLPPAHERRVIFALDELPLLGKIQSIVDLATNGRKHGAAIFAGLQTIAQLRDCYGRETAQTLLACLGSWLVLRVSDSETAEYMSRYLGDEEKTRIVQSGGKSSNWQQLADTHVSNWQEQVIKDRVVLPSELQALPDLRGIFNLAGPTPAAVVDVRIAPDRKVADAYVPAPARPSQTARPLPHSQPAQSQPAQSSLAKSIEIPY